MNKLWKELEVSPEEEKLAEEIVNLCRRNC